MPPKHHRNTPAKRRSRSLARAFRNMQICRTCCAEGFKTFGRTHTMMYVYWRFWAACEKIKCPALPLTFFPPWLMQNIPRQTAKPQPVGMCYHQRRTTYHSRRLTSKQCSPNSFAVFFPSTAFNQLFGCGCGECSLSSAEGQPGMQKRARHVQGVRLNGFLFATAAQHPWL